MSGLGIKQQHTSSDILVMVQRAQNKGLRIINFKEERHPIAPLYTEIKILNLTNIITLNNCMLAFYHIKSSLPAIFDDLFKPFKEQQSQNQGSKEICFKYPTSENLFLWLQISSG